MDRADSPTTFRGTSIARVWYMPNDFEQLLKDLFGEPLNRLTQFSSEQTQRMQTRLQEFAREAVKEELTKIHTELNDLRERVATLEKERVDNAADLV
jgi:gas vesicle protein